MTARTLTRTERMVRDHVMAINLGQCTWCHRPATNACHRLPEGQGGQYIVPDLLPGCGSGSHGCHWRTEQRRDLSYSCGWLIRTGPGDETPAARDLRIASTPALIRSQLGAGWHLLDSLEDGRPLGMPRLAEPDEVPGWMFPGTFDAAIRALHARAA